MDLQSLRGEIDEIDENILRLFNRRMDITAAVARYKQENGLPVHDPAREHQKLCDISRVIGSGREAYACALFALLFELSRDSQNRIIRQGKPENKHAGKFGLLGGKLSHSFSPMIHAELGKYEYSLFEKKPDEIGLFLACGDFGGLNVTVPYKKAVLPYCSALSQAARATGSVNTLTRLADGSLFGDNTDCFGFAYLLKKAGISPAGLKAAVLGSGGSSLAVQAVLRDMSAREIAVISRGGPDSYENLEKHRDCDIIINTTPIGMYPGNGISPLADLSAFKNCRAVIDLIYNPAHTQLLFDAQELGITAVNGLDMLTAQAKKSAEIFTGEIIPDDKIGEITSKLIQMTRNIVLIGMPGCGKTAIGTALAKKLGREFADADMHIEKAAGKIIPEIFAQNGEAAFREMETAALEELCKRSGIVIATGGGVVTRPENRRIIRQNSTVVFLDRDITKLDLTDRPVSQRDGITALAQHRLPIYRQWCDYTVNADDIEQATDRLSRLGIRF
ncbi:MAG: chorismate mutase [Oscillospiraceae bacterium]|nr:chorismate mutase [Oscillospiraceae bacterium]